MSLGKQRHMRWICPGEACAMLQLLLHLERGMGSWPCQEHALVLAQHLYLQQIRHPAAILSSVLYDTHMHKAFRQNAVVHA